MFLLYFLELMDIGSCHHFFLSFGEMAEIYCGFKPHECSADLGVVVHVKFIKTT